LLDTYGRVATDLRVSVTDRCSFRCTYCLPAEGLPWLPTDEVLSDAELLRLVGVFVAAANAHRFDAQGRAARAG
jgi:cyclic pyranopterin phosphate synthase